ncbi:SDR family oxidoreductase [Phytohalomonas tamaricis]|uniref:SDR family oxidoreductase n=1 Tax=Phytohalomonas tamaricis TaxID=2081032 RepID=UPI000D0BBFA0|nr:SDR family oxidoreductase [Phytohalomonas tamaricis]
MNKTCLILGCGDVGSTLGIRLLAKGYRVIGARRNVAALAGTGIEPLALDVNAEDAFDALPHADIVVYAISADRFEEEAYKVAYVDGLARTLKVLEARDVPPAHVFFVSSTSVYGQQDGELVNEESETAPSGFSGQLMVEAEQQLLNSPLPGTLVRFSGIYGPGRDRLIRQVRDGRIAAANPVMHSNRIHRDDCAGVLVYLIERAMNGEPIADRYLASDCESAPIHDVMTWLAKQLKVESHETIQSPLRRRASKCCDNTRLVELGYRFEYPTFREGYRQVLKEAGIVTVETK